MQPGCPYVTVPLIKAFTCFCSSQYRPAAPSPWVPHSLPQLPEAFPILPALPYDSTTQALTLAQLRAQKTWLPSVAQPDLIVQCLLNVLLITPCPALVDLPSQCVSHLTPSSPVRGNR